MNMPRSAKQILGLEIDEISVVGKGANQHSRQLIAKADQGEKENDMQVFDEQGNLLDPESLEDGQVVFGEDGTAYLFELDEEAEPEEVEEEERVPELVGKSANPFRKNAPAKAPVAKSTFSEDLRTELSKALTDRDRDVVISKMLDNYDKLEKQASEAQEIAKAERETRQVAEFTEIAKSYNLPVPDDALGVALYHAAERLDEKDCTVLAKCLAVAGEAIFEEQGAIGGGDNSDVMAYVDKTISKAAGDTVEEINKFFESNPEAYDEYLDEKSNR